MPDVHVLVLQQQRFSKKKKKFPRLNAANRILCFHTALLSRDS